MLRFLDLILGLVGLAVLFPLMLVIWLGGLLDTGSPIFAQTRIGREHRVFTIYKFRTMKLGAPNVPTQCSSPSDVTKFGWFLRRSKLDEIPQLWNVVVGDMSIVGPRPGLPNDKVLYEARIAQNVFDVRPGITGLAQILGVDMSTPSELAMLDRKMISTMSVHSYVFYIVATLFPPLRRYAEPNGLML